MAWRSVAGLLLRRQQPLLQQQQLHTAARVMMAAAPKDGGGAAPAAAGGGGGGKAAAGGAKGGKGAKAAPKAKGTGPKRVIAPPVPLEQLVDVCRGANYTEGGEDPKIKPDSAYPDWLWTLDPSLPKAPLEPDSKRYWQKLRKAQNQERNLIRSQTN